MGSKGGTKEWTNLEGKVVVVVVVLLVLVIVVVETGGLLSEINSS
jgi:hypothetical protein